MHCFGRSGFGAWCRVNKRVAQTRKQNRETKRETRSKSDKNDLWRATTCVENATCLFLSLAPRARHANDDAARWRPKVINLMNWLQGVGVALTKKSPAIHHLLNHGLALYSNTYAYKPKAPQRERQRCASIPAFCEFACECGWRIFFTQFHLLIMVIRGTERQAAGETMGLWNDNDGGWE